MRRVGGPAGVHGGSYGLPVGGMRTLLPSGAVFPQVIRPKPVGPWERWMDRAVAAAASGGATVRILPQTRSVSWLSRRVVGSPPRVSYCQRRR